jgi:hypothetical protein
VALHHLAEIGFDMAPQFRHHATSRTRAAARLLSLIGSPSDFTASPSLARSGGRRRGFRGGRGSDRCFGGSSLAKIARRDVICGEKG